MAQSQEKNKKTLVTKIFLFLGFLALAAIAIFSGKELYKKHQIQNEINKLQNEAMRINRENLEIKNKIAYFESKDYQEREAKDKLSLQSPGENVVVIKPSVAKEQILADESNQNIPLPPKDINPKKWWNYFFKY